jgi:hypothetical protein
MGELVPCWLVDPEANARVRDELDTVHLRIRAAILQAAAADASIPAGSWRVGLKRRNPHSSGSLEWHQLGVMAGSECGEAGVDRT